MGAAVGVGGSGRDVNVDLNIVPFIDLMSCLTAFLLVTAAWSSLSQINIKPKGIARDSTNIEKIDEDPRASILLQKETIWVGISRINDFRQVAMNEDDAVWKKALRELLDEHKKSGYFAERTDIEIGAEDKVEYQIIISAMDTAIAAGFVDVGLADPASLSARPQL
jgi:biopolymer transport protein TolR